MAYLSGHRECVLSTAGTAGAWAMPVWYRSRALEVECLLPHWADVAYHVEQNPHVLLVIPDQFWSADGRAQSGGESDTSHSALHTSHFPLRWLQYRGAARLIVSPDWASLLPEGMPLVRPEERYVAFRVKPERIDLIDESQGWGARDTLDL